MSDETNPRDAVRLIVMRGPGAGRIIAVEEGNNLIGRWDPDAGAFPEIDLASEDIDAKISRKHAVIVRKGTDLTIEDVGSLNGTFINRGPRLEVGKAQQLKAGDEVIVGKTFLRLEIDGEKK